MPWLRWTLALLCTALFEVKCLAAVGTTAEAAELVAASPALRCLHDAAFAQLLERLLRAFAACRVRTFAWQQPHMV
jgi:hypothetical protein